MHRYCCVIWSIHHTLCDENAPKRRKKEAAKHIQRSIIPLIDKAAVVSRDAATIVSPIPCSSYVNKRNEVRRVKHIKEAHPEKQFKLTLIEEYVGVREGSSSRKSQKITAKRAILSCSAKKALPLSIPEPPKPHNGHTYGVGEFFDAMKDLTKKQRTHFMNQVMASPYNYVKKKKSLVYKVLNLHKLGHTYAFDEPWNDEGRRPILNDSQIDKCVISFAANSVGEKMTKEHVNKLLVDMTSTIIRGVPIQSGKRYNPIKRWRD